MFEQRHVKLQGYQLLRAQRIVNQILASVYSHLIVICADQAVV